VTKQLKEKKQNMKTGFIEQNSFKPFDKVNQITA
jgi:hypothetical protein